MSATIIGDEVTATHVSDIDTDLFSWVFKVEG